MTSMSDITYQGRSIRVVYDYHHAEDHLDYGAQVSICSIWYKGREISRLVNLGLIEDMVLQSW